MKLKRKFYSVILFLFAMKPQNFRFALLFCLFLVHPTLFAEAMYYGGATARSWIRPAPPGAVTSWQLAFGTPPPCVERYIGPMGKDLGGRYVFGTTELEWAIEHARLKAGTAGRAIISVLTSEGFVLPAGELLENDLRPGVHVFEGGKKVLYNLDITDIPDEEIEGLLKEPIKKLNLDKAGCPGLPGVTNDLGGCPKPKVCVVRIGIGIGVGVGADAAIQYLFTGRVDVPSLVDGAIEGAIYSHPVTAGAAAFSQAAGATSLGRGDDQSADYYRQKYLEQQEYWELIEKYGTEEERNVPTVLPDDVIFDYKRALNKGASPCTGQNRENFYGLGAHSESYFRQVPRR